MNHLYKDQPIVRGKPVKTERGEIVVIHNVVLLVGPFLDVELSYQIYYTKGKLTFFPFVL